MFENVYTEVYIIMIILALLFFLFSKISINHLIIVIIILLISYALYFYLQRISNDKQNNIAYVQNTLDMDIKDRTETNEKLFYIDKFPKKIKYLKNNEKLIDIITNIRFIKKYQFQLASMDSIFLGRSNPIYFKFMWTLGKLNAHSTSAINILQKRTLAR